ncbi:CvpA family protein [Sphingomonas canadensis]|uniref:CvpA family protein n=1 Tax=Sphingomonas canadensis TaxID=1219257 RepID=A0ABW3HEW3_9SPHN|nr:CvpA family protein [Sphingomonas canadensis]MCW3837576.1 CvpA family protein [Sphingomonas canadensis]
MGFSALDMIVLLGVGAAAAFGFMRGFVTEALSLLAWVLIVIALKLFHAPLAEALAKPVGTAGGAAVLSFVILAGAAYFGGRMGARAIGAQVRTGVLGPIDRALGLGFGAVKGLILASLGFLLLMLVIDTLGGGPKHRPDWVVDSRTYPLLNWTSAGIADFVDRRRRGEPVFGGEDNAAAGNAIEIR